MPRTLPWLVGQNDTGQVKQESTPRKRIKADPDSCRDDQTLKKIPSSPDKRDFFRSSQSPPTSPIRRCPSEEFLIEGLDDDDAWIMVEDEFYAVAQTFTQHLHYAEYVRRTKEVKAQKAMGMDELERPTDGRTAMPKGLERKKEAEALDARQKAGLQDALGENHDEKDDTEDDDLWAGTHLHGLMSSPRKSRSLVSVHAMKSSTRAAAGFAQAASLSSSQARDPSRGYPGSLSKADAAQKMELDLETASEDDDLDLKTTPVAKSAPNRTGDIAAGARSDHGWSTLGSRSERKGSSLSTSKTPGIPAPARTSHQSAKRPKSKVQMLFDDLDELPEPSRHTFSNSDRKRDSASKARLQEGSADMTNSEPKKARHNEVPTFWV